MTSDVWVEWMYEAELLMGALMVEELRSALLSLSPDSPFYGALFPPSFGAEEVLGDPLKPPIEDYEEILKEIGEELPVAPEDADERLEELTEAMLAIDVKSTKPNKPGCGAFEVLLQNTRVSCQRTLGDPGPDVFRLASAIIVISKSFSVNQITSPEDYNHSSKIKFAAGKVDTTTYKFVRIRYEGETLQYGVFVIPYVDDPKAKARAEFLREVASGVYRQEKLRRRERFKVLTGLIDRLRSAEALTKAQREKLAALQLEHEQLSYKVLGEPLERRVRGNGILALYHLAGYLRCEGGVPIAALAAATGVKQSNPNFGKSVIQRGAGTAVFGPIITVGKTRGEYRTHPELVLRVL